ncbi:MAG: VapE domain-containing protein [Pigmentiphaga sp.]
MNAAAPIALPCEHDIIEQFRAAMAEKGIVTSDSIEADGKIHRFHVEGDRKGSKNGWYILHIDERPAGAFGCNKRHGVGTKFSWSAKCQARPLTREERREYAEKMARQKAEKAAAEKARHAAAAERAKAIWEAAKPADDSHPYLKAKGVKAHGLRVGKWEVINPATGEIRVLTDNALLVPFCDRTRALHSLQAILPKKMLGGGTREKDFLKDGAKLGFFHAIGKPQELDGRRVFVICEGYATGASIHEATGHCVLVTFDTSNLMPVATSIRERQADAIILIAADNDRWVTEPIDNPGVRYATRTALAVDGLVAIPQFADLEGKPTDFNDLHARQGLAVVAAQIQAALSLGCATTAAPAAEPDMPWEEVPVKAGSDASLRTPFAEAVHTLQRQSPITAQVDHAPGLSATSHAARNDSDEPAEVGGLGFIPLGTVGEAYVFWRQDTATVEMIRAKDIGADSSILRLSSKQAWELWCCGNSEKGKYDRSSIANMLIQVSKRIGRVDLSLVPKAVAPAETVNAAYVSAMLCARPSAGLLAQAMGACPEWKAASVWFDVFRSEVVVSDTPPSGGTPGVWSDDYDALLSAWASMRWLIPVNAGMASEAVMALARQDERHPVRDYLNDVKWDGVPRLDTWLIDVAGCADTPYVRAIGAKTLIGAVARVMRPGCKLDTMLVLEGRQGLRKSSLIEALVPDASWHSDSLGGDIGTKDAMAGLSGKWIIELAELANLRGSDVNKIKHFISDPSDSYRPFYGRRTRDFPRQCVFIGTINPEGDGSYLHDSTGGRRFWPVECTKVDIARMRTCRDQLWAEAAARYGLGETWWLTDEQEAMATVAQEGRQEENPWIQRVSKYLVHITPSENGGNWGGRRAREPEVVFVSDIFEAFTGRAYLRRDLVEGKSIGNALKSLGWESKNGPVNGVSCRHWRRSGTDNHKAENGSPI